MAEGRVTQTGMTEARRTVERLPAAVTEALRGVAKRTAVRIRDAARQRLLAQTRGSGRTAAAIAVREEPAERQVLVESQAVRPAPANLVLWLEFGTSRMRARPYMRPAVEGARNSYHREMREAVEQTARKTGL